MNENPMYEEYVKVSWCPQDVKSIYPELSDEKCQQLLENVSGYLEDRLIELGSETLEMLLEMEVEISEDYE